MLRDELFPQNRCGAGRLLVRSFHLKRAGRPPGRRSEPAHPRRSKCSTMRAATFRRSSSASPVSRRSRPTWMGGRIPASAMAMSCATSARDMAIIDTDAGHEAHGDERGRASRKLACILLGSIPRGRRGCLNQGPREAGRSVALPRKQGLQIRLQLQRHPAQYRSC